jgi:hypothetical protein
VDWQQYTVHRWQIIVHGLQIGEIRSLVYKPGLAALETSSRVAKFCGITGSSQIKFCSWITLPLKLMYTEFRGSLQHQLGSLVFLFLSLPFSMLKRNHQLKYGSCSMYLAVADLQIGRGIITEAYQTLIHESLS